MGSVVSYFLSASLCENRSHQAGAELVLCLQHPMDASKRNLKKELQKEKQVGKVCHLNLNVKISGYCNVNVNAGSKYDLMPFSDSFLRFIMKHTFSSTGQRPLAL